MLPGQTYSASITMANTGTTSWDSANWYGFGSAGPQDNQFWGLKRAALGDSEVIQPGQQKTFNFPIVAPSTPGIYNFQWRLVQELTEWFGDLSPAIQVVWSTGEVVNAGATTLTADAGVVITSSLLSNGTTQQILMSTQAANVAYGNGMSVGLTPCVEAVVNAKPGEIDAVSTGTVSVVCSGAGVEFSSGAVSLRNSSGMTEISVSNNTGALEIDVPQGAFSGKQILTVQLPDASPPAAGTNAKINYKGAGVAFELSAENGAQPLQQVQLKVSYAGADTSVTDPRLFLICRYDAPTSQWLALPSSVDATGKTVNAYTDHFSHFQVMIKTLPTTLDYVLAYPNPMQAYRGDTKITLTNMPLDTSVRIFSIAGELIRELHSDANGQAVWDINNNGGARVASGVYLAMVKCAQGSKKILKLAVIK